MNKPPDPLAAQRCLWSQTADAPTMFPVLEGDVEADVAVIGAGYTGLSAALHLARAGKNVVVLEAHEPGCGASGRNAAGYLPFYLDRTPESVRGLFGERAGNALNRMVAESGRLMLGILERYHIDADLRPNSLLLGGHDPTSKGRAKLQSLREQWIASGQAIDFIDRDTMREYTGSNAFAHGLRFHDSGTLNPLSLCRGLARAAHTEGATIFCRSAATALTRCEPHWRVTSQRGSVVARDVLIATDGYSANASLWPALERTMYQIPAAVVASRPARELVKLLSPRGFALADDNAASHLYLMFDRECRLVASLLPPRRDSATPAAVAQPFESKLRRVFRHLPWDELPRIEWEHFWLGIVAFTAARVPCAIRLAPHLHAMGGYSGQGITAAIGAGSECAQFICADSNERACRLPFVDARPVPMRGMVPSLARQVIAPLIRATDRTYWHG